MFLSRAKEFARPHAPSDRFGVVVTAFDAHEKPIAEPVARMAIEPELAAVVALAALQKDLESRKQPWHRIEVVIEHR